MWKNRVGLNLFIVSECLSLCGFFSRRSFKQIDGMVMMLVLIGVMAILLSGALFLTLIAYTLHSRGNQLKQMNIPRKGEQNVYGHNQPHEQHCCMCGNLRNRKSHVEPEEFALGKEEHSNGKLWSLLQPFVESACENRSLKHGKLEIPRGASLNLLENVHKLKDLRAKLQSAIAKSKCTALDTSLGEKVSRINSTSPADVNRDLKAGHEIISVRSLGLGAPALSPPSGMLSSELTMDVPLNSEIIDNMKVRQEPKKRLVLEILVSPSQATVGDTNHFQHATGVRLKLETNDTFGSLSRYAATTTNAMISSSGVERDAVQRTETDSRNGIVNDAACRIQSGTFVALEKDLQSIGGLVRIGEVDIHAAEHASKLMVEAEQSHLTGLADLHSSQHGSSHKNGHPALTSVIAGQVGTTCMLDCVAEVGISDALSPLSTSQSLNSTKLSKLLNPKVLTGNIHLHETIGANSCNAKAFSNADIGILKDLGKEACRNVTHQSYFNFTTLEDLGYLQIQSLEASSKSKSNRNDGTAVIASALTGLTVDAVGENSKQTDVLPYRSLCGDSCLKGMPQQKNCKNKMHEYANDDEAHREESGSERGAEERDAQYSLLNAQGSANQTSGSMGKTEKKKKKNRSKRQNAKLAIASGSNKDAQSMQESSKCLPVSCKQNETSNAFEVGCLCGTATKEGVHSRNCPYPFTSSGSMIQRKLKEQYDELVHSNINKTLTLAQVGRFTTSLVEAKAALQHKSDQLQRKFTITKSLLCKADKSSFDRLCGQIYGLEVEQRRIEEDTIVYNRLQAQLKLSPAYQKMLEYGQTRYPLQSNTGHFSGKLDGEAKEISFEELLAQEKKDSFWQKYGLSRSSVQVN